MKNDENRRRRQSGFSLIEMLVAIMILTVITGAIFSQINVAQKNAKTEQIRLDLFQQVREFTDQIARDARSTGYPNSRNFQNGTLGTASADPTTYVPPYSDPKNAVGLVKVNYNELWLESAVEGNGDVWVIRYRLINDGEGCPCLQRSQTKKVQGDPYTQQTGVDNNYVTEVQHVSNGTTDDPIFRAYHADDGSAYPLPISFDQKEIADLNSVLIKVSVKSPVPDGTGKYPTVTMMSTVRIANCSQGSVVSPTALMAC